MKNNLLSEKLIYTGESQTPTHLHLCTYNLNEMQESSGTNFHEVSNSLNYARIVRQKYRSRPVIPSNQSKIHWTIRTSIGCKYTG